MSALLDELAAARHAQRRLADESRRRSLVTFFSSGSADVATLALALGVGPRAALDRCSQDLELGIIEYSGGRLALTERGRLELEIIRGGTDK